MKIYIELVVVALCFAMFILWWIWYSFTTRRLLKKYNPNDDKSRRQTKGGLKVGNPEAEIIEHGRTESVEEPSNDSVGSRESEERELLSKATVDADGDNKHMARENSTGNRTRVRKLKSIFKRRRKWMNIRIIFSMIENICMLLMVFTIIALAWRYIIITFPKKKVTTNSQKNKNK